MRILLNLPIRYKLVMAFGICLCFTIGLSLFSVTRLNILSANSDNLLGNVEGMQPLSRMARDPNALAALAIRGAVTHSPEQLQSIVTAEEAIKQDYLAQWNIYVPTMDPGEETSDGGGFNTSWGHIAATLAQILVGERAHDTSLVQTLLASGLDPELAAFNKYMNADLLLQVNEANAFADNTASVSSDGLIGTFVTLAVAAVSTVLVGWIILRSVAAPVTAMTSVMRRIAVQEFDVDVPGVGRLDEIGAMAGAVHVFRENARERMRLESAATQLGKELDNRLQAAEAAAAAGRVDQDQVVRCMKRAWTTSPRAISFSGSWIGSRSNIKACEWIIIRPWTASSWP